MLLITIDYQNLVGVVCMNMNNIEAQTVFLDTAVDILELNYRKEV